ncbi:MAG: PQQ-binding-like beta-propeller repeat protein, partial [Verrucomicrobiota bacterium]
MALLRLPVFLLFVLCSQAEDDLTLTVYDQPGPLSPSAITSDWPRFLGPSDDASTPETHLIHSFPETGPKLLWEVTKGEGYTSPAIVQDQLILFHNVADIDRIESRHPETGALQWTYTYPNRYRDRYGYGTGPRAAPVISGEYVLTLSATSQLHCLHRKDGSLKWKRDLLSDYQPGPYFFGHGPCPLVWNDLVLLPIGGKGVSVAAFDLESGETRWEAR